LHPLPCCAVRHVLAADERAGLVFICARGVAGWPGTLLGKCSGTRIARLGNPWSRIACESSSCARHRSGHAAKDDVAVACSESDICCSRKRASGSLVGAQMRERLCSDRHRAPKSEGTEDRRRQSRHVRHLVLPLELAGQSIRIHARRRLVVEPKPQALGIALSEIAELVETRCGITKVVARARDDAADTPHFRIEASNSKSRSSPFSRRAEHHPIAAIG